MKTCIHTLAFLSIFAFLPFNIYSQDDKALEEFSSLMLNLSYTSNNMEYLSGSTENIPTLFFNTSFFHKSGLYLGGTYSTYFSDTIPSSEIDFEAGYQKYFDNGFDVDLSYNWHQFNGDSLLEGLNYNHAVTLMVGQEINKFYLSADLSYKLGNTNNMFFDLSLSRFIQIDGIFSDNDVLLINPGISLSFGTDYWLYEDMTDTDKATTFLNLKSSGYSYENFSYEGFNIFLPVSYGVKNIYITGSWLYRIPGDKYKYLGWENKSGFMFSLTYFLNFANK